MQSTLEMAEEQARKNGAAEIVRIKLRVGLVSGVVPEALEFAFETLREGTMAREARLEIERVPGEFRCAGCGKVVRLSEVRFDCPACDGMLVLASGGGDLELAELEIV